MAPIAMKNIVKTYDNGVLAVNDVSIDVPDGEFIVLLGPTGCGKSTLLRMIVGLEDITSGDMLIDGERVNDNAPSERNLALVFQNYALYPHLSVYENIAFPLHLSKELTAEDIDAKVREAATALELDGQLDDKPGDLSDGQRQRVAMGRAIVRQARALLFDEPLANLDAKPRAALRTEISRLQRKLGITTVYATTDQTEAMTLADRVAVLRHGAVEQLATPRELYEQPANLFVARLIGSPTMNFVPATVDGAAVRLPFVTLDLPPETAGAVRGREWLIAGIRPEHFADASLVDAGKRKDGKTFSAAVEVTEWLGSQHYAYLGYQAQPGLAERLAEQERELDGEQLRSQVVVALDAASPVRDGQTAELFVDSTRVHLFDAATGENLTRVAGQHAG